MRTVHIEKHDLALLRRKDEDVVLAAPNREGRHEAPESVQVTDLGKHLSSPLGQRVFELPRDELNGGELGEEALCTSSVCVREQRVVEAEKPRHIPEDVVRKPFHEC